MNLEYVPTLKTQRELYEIPRGMVRFRAYLASMIDAGSDDIKLPLVAMNPMAREHVPALLDELIALDADGVAARAIADSSPRVADVARDVRVTLVVVDDARGGWTNRFASEFSGRFETHAMTKRGWLVGALWSSEPPLLGTVRETVLTTVYRAAYIHRHGPARTLGERMRQEGYVMAAAGCTRPVLDADDLDYTREVIGPHRDAADMRTTVECLFGDVAAPSLGFTRRGLSPWAGLAVALHDARA